MASALWESVEDGRGPELSPEWQAEIAKRIQEIDSRRSVIALGRGSRTAAGENAMARYPIRHRLGRRGRAAGGDRLVQRDRDPRPAARFVAASQGQAARKSPVHAAALALEPATERRQALVRKYSIHIVYPRTPSRRRDHRECSRQSRAGLLAELVSQLWRSHMRLQPTSSPPPPSSKPSMASRGSSCGRCSWRSWSRSRWRLSRMRRSRCWRRRGAAGLRMSRRRGMRRGSCRSWTRRRCTCPIGWGTTASNR